MSVNASDYHFDNLHFILICLIVSSWLTLRVNVDIVDMDMCDNLVSSSNIVRRYVQESRSGECR